MKSCTGKIKLMIGEMVINQAGYHSKIQREAVIETWRYLHGYDFEKMIIQIKPHILTVNENRWSRIV